MTRINTNLPSQLGALYMNRNMEVLNLALQRLTTGLRINSSKDDPAGVIISDVLRGELTGIDSAITNAERASNLTATAEGSMAAIADILIDLKQAVYEVANQGSLTSDELKSKQQQIDNDLASINQLVGSSTFAGQKLLDGSLAYKTSGVDTAAIDALAVNVAPVSLSSGPQPIQMTLLTQAKPAELFLPAGALAGDVTLKLTGPDGSAQLTFTAGTTLAEVRQSLQGITSRTGLTADYVNGDPTQGLRIYSDDYGSQAAVTVEIVSGNPANFPLTNSAGTAATTAKGVDARANINGAQVTGNGLLLHYAVPSADIEIQLDLAWNNAGLGTTIFKIDSGGTLFQLGSRIGSDQQYALGIAALDTTRLGWSTVGYLSDLASGGSMDITAGNFEQMNKIVDQAIQQVAAARGRIGSFQNNTLNMAINSLKQSKENVAAARSTITDADYAVETAIMTRQQVLLEATQSAMAMAAQVPQNILDLLRV